MKFILLKNLWQSLSLYEINKYYIIKLCTIKNSIKFNIYQQAENKTCNPKKGMLLIWILFHCSHVLQG